MTDQLTTAEIEELLRLADTLHRLFGEALGVIKGTSMRDDVGEEWRNKLAAIAEELNRKYRELCEAE